MTLTALLAPPLPWLFAMAAGGGGEEVRVASGGAPAQAGDETVPTAWRGTEAGAGGRPSPVAPDGPGPPPRRAGGDSVPTVGRAWPVGVRPQVLRGWEPPATVYGAGHRGVDLAAAPGTPVRAVADGRVSFAGRVAGKGVVSVELAGTGEPPLRTTYEPVRASVTEGTEVAAGEVIGTVEATGSHCTAPCAHWGLLRGDTYLDPLSLLPPWLLDRGPSRLLPVLGVPLPD
ncbi:M23 family metallopeptidase [Streptomyces sp. NPDC005908]|uniref:M23 family metallopeptidase n=1 Tax=Streptomyces sp. NPDC005908 TaxID=3157084 RepID=UPI0034060888